MKKTKLILANFCFVTGLLLFVPINKGASKVEVIKVPEANQATETTSSFVLSDYLYADRQQNEYVLCTLNTTNVIPNFSLFVEPSVELGMQTSTYKEVEENQSDSDNSFRDEEIQILYRITEAEATEGNIKQKQDVANVILNRVESDEFPDTIEEVVFEKTGSVYQFSPIKDKRYYTVEITEETIEACNKALTEEDTTYGSLYFDCAKNSWASRNREFVMDDGIHNFYR